MSSADQYIETATAIAAVRVVEALERLGVSVAFGLPGVHNLAIWKALSESAIRLVGVRHEQAAVYAADGYARATGRLGVAVVTTGPGAANTLGATGEAMASGSPVLVIATDIPAAIRRPGMDQPMRLIKEVVASDDRTVVIHWKQSFTDADALNADKNVGLAAMPRNLLEEKYRTA